MCSHRIAVGACVPAWRRSTEGRAHQGQALGVQHEAVPGPRIACSFCPLAILECETGLPLDGLLLALAVRAQSTLRDGGRDATTSAYAARLQRE